MKALDWCRARPWTWAVAAGVSLGAVGYGAGRFSAPTKVEERERIVERIVTDEKAVAKAVSDARSTWEREVKDNTRIVTRYVEGKPVERIEYRDRDTSSSGGKVEVKTVEVVVERKVEVVKEVEVTKLVERDCPRVTLLGTFGSSLSGGLPAPPSYGLTAAGRIWGPLTVGAGVDGNAQIIAGRVMAGIQF